ncbi:MAG: MopE-related protein, partial [Flavobacteriales bacterium]
MKSLRLILVLSLFAFSGKVFSQGMPISVIISNADCAVTVAGTYVDSVTGTSGSFQLFAADPAGTSFMGTVSINALGANYIISVCATDCNGVTNCATGPMVLGAVTTFNIDMGGNGGGVVDNDGDGFNSFADCNDNDANINANATEVCDGMDNNCDGVVDEGCNTGGCTLDIVLVPDS